MSKPLGLRALRKDKKPEVSRRAVYMDAQLRAELGATLAAQGVLNWQRAAWFKAALKRLAKDDPTYSTVGRAEQGKRFGVRMGITVDKEFEEMLVRAYRQVRTGWPEAGPLFSAVMRAAVRHELQNRVRQETLSLTVPENLMQEVSERLIHALGGEVGQGEALTDAAAVVRRLEGLVKGLATKHLATSTQAATAPKASTS